MKTPMVYGYLATFVVLFFLGFVAFTVVEWMNTLSLILFNSLI